MACRSKIERRIFPVRKSIPVTNRYLEQAGASLFQSLITTGGGDPGAGSLGRTRIRWLIASPTIDTTTTMSRRMTFKVLELIQPLTKLIVYRLKWRLAFIKKRNKQNSQAHICRLALSPPHQRKLIA